MLQTIHVTPNSTAATKVAGHESEIETNLRITFGASYPLHEVSKHLGFVFAQKVAAPGRTGTG
jgi:hypothetical protein